MSSRYEELRREMRANFELTWGGQADANKRIEAISVRLGQHAERLEQQADKIAEQGQQIAEQGRQIAEQGQQIAEQGQQIAEQGRQIARSMRDTAKIGREVVAIGDQTVGRLRQMDHRFGQFLDVLESDSRAQDEAIADLKTRVARLEGLQGPAA